MHAASHVSILTVKFQREQDLVTARQRARQLAALLNFEQQDQTRIATAVSEITRNAHQYAGSGRLEFSIDVHSRPQFLWIEVTDQGPGIRDADAALSETGVPGAGIGLAGTSRLMDEFQIHSSIGRGTTVRFGKALPAGSKPIAIADIGGLCATLAEQLGSRFSEELERQNRELLQLLDTLRIRESELEQRREQLARLNLELEETNRGVVALYAELDEKAIALRHAAEMKSRFLSHITHEFRTPVNSILALTRLLLNRTDGELSSEQAKQISYIRDAGAHLAEMVNDLLDLAKVEAGKVEVRPARIDIGQFLGAMRSLTRPLAIRESVALIFEDPPPNLLLESDESKLGQILRNLVSNALKFTEEGEVRVSVGLSPTRDSIIFAVKDTGIGIDPKDQERIFQEFAQLENPLQKQVKGTGLGLSLSRGLAEILGGTLVVESAIGAGSTFTLKLPYQIAAEVDAGEAVAGRSTASGILVVDDEPAARYLAHQLFRGSRHLILEVSGLDAAERARFDAPALILLDLAMPDRSGFEVLEDLKSDERTKDIPVVIHTSKVITEADSARLQGRHAAVLPKAPEGRLPGLLAIRTILGEPGLFSTEPEFRDE